MSKTFDQNRNRLGDYDEWFEDGHKLSGSPDFLGKAQQLGAQRWELVSVTATADITGALFAGSTTDMQFFYKRPKP